MVWPIGCSRRSTGRSTAEADPAARHADRRQPGGGGGEAPTKPKTEEESPIKAAEEAASTEAATDAAPVPARPPSKLVRSKVDPEAAWTKKNGRRTFGYKAHVGVDQGSGIIRGNASPRPMSTIRSRPTADLRRQAAIYADEAYTTRDRRKKLRELVIKDRMMHRPNKHHPLTPRQIQHNRAIGRRRAPVEQVFAQLKRSAAGPGPLLRCRTQRHPSGAAVHRPQPQTPGRADDTQNQTRLRPTGLGPAPAAFALRTGPTPAQTDLLPASPLPNHHSPPLRKGLACGRGNRTSPD